MDQPARGGTLILCLGCFLLGAGISALWFSSSPPAPAISQSEAGLALPESADSVATPASLADRFTEPRGSHVVSADLHSASLDTGVWQLRAAALGQFEKNARVFEARREAVEKKFLQAENDQSEERREAARTQLQQLQAEQADTLKEIAAKSKGQIEAFLQGKNAAR